MKERPILMSAPMVRAILAGTKTQTRQPVRPRKCRDLGCELAPHELAGEVNGGDFRNALCAPGDRLWVRETFIDLGAIFLYRADACAEDERALVAPREWWRPAIQMPRPASRITLEVTAVRVEKLHGISEADAMAEGIVSHRIGTGDARTGLRNAFGVACDESAWACDAVQAYQALWEQINGPGSWDANPWVWAVEFKRVEGQA